MAQADDGADDGRGGPIADQIPGEASIQLEGGDLEPGQVGQRAIAGAEVIDGELEAGPDQAGEVLLYLVGILHQHAFGYLQLQGGGGDAVAPGAGLDVVAQAGVTKLQGGEVDRQHQTRPHRLPAGELGTTLLQHQITEPADESQLLGKGNEFVRRYHAELGVGPAAEQLGTVQLVLPGTDDGLVDGHQFGRTDRLGQVGAEPLASLQLLIEQGVEQGAVLLQPLALGQGGLRMAQQTLGIVGPPLGDAEEGGDLDAVLLDLVGGHQLLLQSLAPLEQRLARLGQQQGEIIGGDPAQQGVGRGEPLQALGDLAEQAVGDADAESVIDLAKVLQIDEQQACRAPPQVAAGLQKVGELEQAGEAVVVLLLLQLGLSGAQPSDIAAQGQYPEGEAIVIRHLDPDDLQVATLSPGVQQTILATSHGHLGGQVLADVVTQHLARLQPHEIEEGLVAIEHAAIVILEPDGVGNGVQQAALQQLLLFEGLLQRLVLAYLVHHAEQGEGVAEFIVERHLVGLDPVVALLAMAELLLVQQGVATGEDLVVLFPKQVAPGQFPIRLADDLVRVGGAGVPGKLAIDQQITASRIPTENRHGELIDEGLKLVWGKQDGKVGSKGKFRANL